MSFDQSTDYGVLLRRAMESGADKETVELLLNKRVEKALSDPGLVRYANDEIYREALSYIAQAESSRQDDYELALESARQAAVAAREEQTRQILEGLGEQEKTISATAARDRTAAYAAARLSALGGEEELAAMGLGQGNGTPSSGYQETSRIARDVALQNNLGDVNSAETDALRQLAAAIRQARQTGLADVAALEEEYRLRYAEYQLQRSQAEKEERETLYQRQQDALQNYYRQAQLQQAQQQAQQQAAYEQQQTAYKQQQDAYNAALKRWQLTGVVSAADAPILGLPAGTTTASYQAQLYNQAKSGGRSSGSRSGTSGSSSDSMTRARSLVYSQGASAACEYLKGQGYSGTKLRSALKSLGLSDATIAGLVDTVVKPGTSTAATSKGVRLPTIK